MTYRVLIADDEENIRIILQRICQGMGWMVDLAADGQEALEWLLTKPHEIFILDQIMPVIKGLELVPKILEHEIAPSIIILTGDAKVKDAVLAMKEGVFEYVQKGGSVDDLVEILRRAAAYHENQLHEILQSREYEQKIHSLQIDNQRFRTLLQLTQDMIFIVDRINGRILECNAAACKQLGYAQEEMINLRISDIDQQFLTGSWDDFIKVFPAQQSRTLETTLRKNNGTLFPVEVTVTHIQLDGVSYIVGIARNTTERKQIEQLREESEEKFQLIGKAAQDAIIMMNSKGMISYWNPSAMRIFGYAEEEAIGQELHSFLIPTHYYAAYRQNFKKFLETGEGNAVGKTLELMACRKNGKEFLVELSLSAVKIKNQWNAIGIIRDITERKQLEEALKSERDLLHTLLDNSPDYIYFKDAESRYKRINRALARFLGLEDPQEAVGTIIFDYVLQEDAQRLYNDEQKIIHSGIPVIDKEQSGTKRDGQSFWISETKIPLKNSEGQVVELVGITRDITRRKLVEIELDKARKQTQIESSKLQATIENIEAGIIVADPANQITEVNSWILCKMKTLSEMVLGRSLSQVVHDHIGLVIDPILQNFQAETIHEHVVIEQKLDDLNVLLRFQPVYHHDIYEGLILSIMDVSALIYSKESAEQENVSKSEYLARIAKEMHTPLNGILSMIELLLNTKLDNGQRCLVETVRDCGNSLESVISNLDSIDKIKSREIQIDMQEPGEIAENELE